MEDHHDSSECLTLDRSSDLGTILDAWNVATNRLLHTHEALRAELGRLSDELAEKNRQLERKNRLADLGQIASHIAHEVRNNLVPVKLYLSLLRRKLAGDSLDLLDKVSVGITSLDAMTEDMLHFAADREPNVQSVDALALVAELQQALAPQLRAQQVQFIADVPAGMTAWADQGMLRRAALNIVLNSLDALPQGGIIRVAVRRDADATRWIFTDDGPGLPEAALTRAFEPFYTTKSHGTGLGLAIVYHIAQVHGGQALAENLPTGGARFTLVFPVRETENLAA